MNTPSLSVYSSQTAPHPHLQEIVRKHCRTTFQRPYLEHSRQAFREAEQFVAASGATTIILDSCCGTGESTRTIARSNPEACVIGIDKSAHRLRKHQHILERANGGTNTITNYKIVRADVIDIWRLIAEAVWSIDKHYILYPNPYPKPDHFLRRWHGHPVFPIIVTLSNNIELRTNWCIYAEEMLAAYTSVCTEYRYTATTAFTTSDAKEHCNTMPFNTEPLTAFERKYTASGHTLYQVFCRKREQEKTTKQPSTKHNTANNDTLRQ
jgi:tRNA (guanine-N7-)-methyltransferase